MDASAYKRKFKQLFDTILKDNIEISAYHSENILKHLEGSRDNCTEKILETPFFTELNIYVLKNSNSATTSVKVFIVNIVSIVLRNEVHFNRFLHTGGFELVAPKSRSECRALPAALHRAYVQQAGTLADHYSGLKYIMDQKIWRQLLQPYTHHRPPALERSIYDFMSKLIWKLNEYDEEAALLEILQFIVQPIATFEFESTTSRGLEYEMAISDQLITYLHTLVAILGDIDNLLVPNKVVPNLMLVGVVESKLAAILEETREPALAALLAELGVRYHLAASLLAARRDPAAAGRANEYLNGSISKIITTLVKKRSIPMIMDFSSKCHNYWYKVQATGHSISFEQFGRRFEMQDTFLIILLVPLFTKCKAKQKPVDDHELQEGFESFTIGLGENFPRDIVRPAYSLRALVEEMGTDAACVLAVRELRPGRLCRRQAGVVFQILFYVLSEYVLSDGAGALVLLHNPLRAPHDEQLVAAVLDAIKMLLEEHDLSWHESVEIINLQAALINLIKQNILPMKPLVQVLELMTLSVRKLLPPELALLLTSARGGSLHEAAAAVRALLGRPEPRVRAAALAFIHIFAEVAYVKFVALRRVISEHALLAGAARAALGDPAAPAQAAALRCLAAGARCHCLWAELLAEHHNLYEHLLHIVRHGADGEVRAEAAGVLTAVYVGQSVGAAFVRRVSRVMARAAADACPRAQLAALAFWRQAAKTACADRGMIDRQFPPVTFSKEKRKIITLTDDEIRKQLHAIMDSLSTSGCLGVLLKCLAPHNDLRVIENAYEFANGLVSLLEFYKFDVKPARDDLVAGIFADGDPGDPGPEVVSPQVFIDTVKWTDSAALIDSTKLASGPADLDTLLDEVISPGNECNKHTV